MMLEKAEGYAENEKAISGPSRTLPHKLGAITPHPQNEKFSQNIKAFHSSTAQLDVFEILKSWYHVGLPKNLRQT